MQDEGERDRGEGWTKGEMERGGQRMEGEGERVQDLL